MGLLSDRLNTGAFTAFLVVRYRWAHFPFVFDPINIACRPTHTQAHTRKDAHAKGPFILL